MLYKLLKIGFYAYKKKIKFIPGIINRLTRLLYSCDIPCQIEYMDSTRFGHNGLGCVINAGTKIGDNVYISHNVTIGKSNRESKDFPVIEDDVFIGAGAIILGKIIVGKGSIIGAGAIVVKDIPPYSTVIGVNEIIKIGTR